MIQFQQKSKYVYKYKSSSFGNLFILFSVISIELINLLVKYIYFGPLFRSNHLDTDTAVNDDEEITQSKLSSIDHGGRTVS